MVRCIGDKVDTYEHINTHTKCKLKIKLFFTNLLIKKREGCRRKKNPATPVPRTM